MTRLDRYVLGVFLPALGMFALTLLFLVVAVDFASKLIRFLELKTVVVPLFIGWYYLVRLPLLLTLLLPAVLLFASIFTVIKLSRTNEILPIASSGVSLRRMSAPFLGAAMAGSILIAALEEVVLPVVGPVIAETDDILSSRSVNYSVEDWDGTTKIWGFEYDPAAKRMSRRVEVTVVDATATPLVKITGEEAEWDPKRKRWVVFKGVVTGLLEGDLVPGPGGRPEPRRTPIPPEGFVVASPLSPEGLQRSSSFMAQMKFDGIRKLRMDAKRYPHVPSYRMRIYNRFAFPLAPLLLVLLGLPGVMAAQSKGFVKGLFSCFLLAIGYYLTYFAFMDFGNRGTLPPLWAAWLPVGAFGGFGLFSFARMRT